MSYDKIFSECLVILPLVGQPQPHPTHANTDKVGSDSGLGHLLVKWLHFSFCASIWAHAHSKHPTDHSISLVLIGLNSL